MTPRSPARALPLGALGLALVAGIAIRTPSAASLPPIHAAVPDGMQGTHAIQATQKGTPVSTTRASGTFTVKLTPQELHKKIEGAPVGRLSIDKLFQGDLEGTSIGEMLSAGTDVKGSAGYVAIERVTRHAAREARHVRAAAQRHHDAWRAAALLHRRAGLRHR